MKLFPPILALLAGCASTLSQDRPPGAKSLYDEALDDLDSGLYPEALKGFSDVKAKFPYSEYAALADLRTADTHFERGKYAEAVDAYRNFMKYHPNHDEGSYAMLRIGDAYYEQVPGDWWFLPPSAEKDQAQTRHAITAYTDMLARYGDAKQAQKARERLAECRRKLADHEMYVARFYFDRERFRAAAARAEGLLQSYPGVGLDEEALWMAIRSHLALKDHAAARAAIDRLTMAFPNGRHSSNALDMLNKIDPAQDAPGRPGSRPE